MSFKIKRMPFLLLILSCLVFTFTAQNTMAGTEADPNDIDAPLAPLGPVPVPPDNPISDVKVELGKFLYFDPKLGGDASLGCVDCHDPKLGWAFADPICRGYPGTVHWRNCQTTVNTGYWNKLFWTGSSKSLEKQAKSAAQGGVAGNGEKDVMVERLKQTPAYMKMFKQAFGAPIPTVSLAYAAIATFERAMLSQTDTPLDRYLKGDKNALSKKAKKGLELFKGKANCIECHNGALLTDEKMYNLGVPRAEEWIDTGLNQITYRFELYAKGVHEKMYRESKDDLGLYFDTKRKKDIGKFRTPQLRYLKYTAPYMHAGQFFTLEEVIDFYNEGGGENEWTKKYGNKTPILKPLNLTDGEKEALVVFLEEISGEEIQVGEVKVPDYGVFPDVPGLTQAEAKRIGLEEHLASWGLE